MSVVHKNFISKLSSFPPQGDPDLSSYLFPTKGNFTSNKCQFNSPNLPGTQSFQFSPSNYVFNYVFGSLIPPLTKIIVLFPPSQNAGDNVTTSGFLDWIKLIYRD